jgi:L-threonylcarbamoyladenylate synthase
MVINADQAAVHLESGGLLLYPTDTVYGFGCLPAHIFKLCKIKPRKTGFIVIVDNIERYIDWIDEDFSLPEMSRPTTWVLKASEKVPIEITLDGYLAIRQVTHSPILKLLEKLNEPLISTSANLPGKTTAKSVQDLESIFPFPILEGEIGKEQPSQIIHYRTRKIIRP